MVERVILTADVFSVILMWLLQEIFRDDIIII